MNGSHFQPSAHILHIKVVLGQRDTDQIMFGSGGGLSSGTALATPSRTPFSDFQSASYSVRDSAGFVLQRRLGEARVELAQPTEPPANRQMIVHLRVSTDNMERETYERLGSLGQLENELRVQISELFDLHATTVHVQASYLDGQNSFGAFAAGGKNLPATGHAPIMQTEGVTIMPGYTTSTPNGGGSSTPPVILINGAGAGGGNHVTPSIAHDRDVVGIMLDRVRVAERERDEAKKEAKTAKDTAQSQWKPTHFILAAAVAFIGLATLYFLSTRPPQTAANGATPQAVDAARETILAQRQEWITEFERLGIPMNPRAETPIVTNVSERDLLVRDLWPQDANIVRADRRVDSATFVMESKAPNFELLRMQQESLREVNDLLVARGIYDPATGLYDAARLRSFVTQLQGAGGQISALRSENQKLRNDLARERELRREAP